MSSVLSIPQPPVRLDEEAWEDLLNFIEERRVIPIIGPELLKVETETGRPIGVLVDLQGPKLRIGAFADRTVMLTPGQIFTLDSDPKLGDATRVELPHPEILQALRPGDQVDRRNTSRRRRPVVPNR